MQEFERICKVLKKNGYRPVSMDGPTKRIFVDNDARISITVEFDKDKLTARDEKKIICRLKELGYLE